MIKKVRDIRNRLELRFGPDRVRDATLSIAIIGVSLFLLVVI